MKKISSLVLISIFFFAGLLASNIPLPVDANILMEIRIDDEDGGSGGGSYSEPVPPAETDSTIQFVANINDTVYRASDDIVLTTSLTYNTCENAARNMKIEGRIVDSFGTIRESHEIYNNTMTGGVTVSPMPKTYQKLPAGEYTMIAKVTAYAPEYYFVEFPGESISYLTNYTLDGLKSEVMSLFGYKYEYQHPLRFLAPDGSYIPVGYIPPGTQVLASKEIPLPFTVIDVTVYVNGKVGDTVTSGQDVQVSWDSKFANRCICTCKDVNNNIINCGTKTTEPTSCGTGIGEDVKHTITGVTTKTKFEVICSKP